MARTKDTQRWAQLADANLIEAYDLVNAELKVVREKIGELHYQEEQLAIQEAKYRKAIEALGLQVKTKLST